MIDAKHNISLYGLAGHTLVFNDQGTGIIYGAGYFEGNFTAESLLEAKLGMAGYDGPDSGQYSPFEEGQLCYLDMEKLEWDDKGRTTLISGLGPFLKTTGKEKEIKITSDRIHPKIADGNVYIKLEGHGDSEFWVKMLFGKIVGIGKHEIITPSPSTTNNIQEYKELNYATFPPVIGSITNGFRLYAFLKSEKYSENGTLAGEFQYSTVGLTRMKDGKMFDLELADNKFSDSRVKTKLFGALMVDWKWADRIWLLKATDQQIMKIQQWMEKQ